MAWKSVHVHQTLWPRYSSSLLFPSASSRCYWFEITATDLILPFYSHNQVFETLFEAHSVAGLQISIYFLSDSQNRQTTIVRIDTRTKENLSEKLSLNFKYLILKKRLTVNTYNIQLHSVKIDS